VTVIAIDLSFESQAAQGQIGGLKSRSPSGHPGPDKPLAYT
jgi:hypothetical protein